MNKNRPELYEKTVLITGATDGIGKETALMFAKVGAKVLIHGRNPAKIATTMDALRQANPSGQFFSYQADFSSLDDVRNMAAAIQQGHSQIDILINNAGLYPDKRVISKDGFEQTLQVNYISAFLLTKSLTPFRGFPSGTHHQHELNWAQVRVEQHPKPQIQPILLALGQLLSFEIAHPGLDY